jgi:lysozyme
MLSDSELKKLYCELVLDEGKKLKAYLDTKKIPTVGIGFNVRANDTTPIIGRKISRAGQVITEEECYKLYEWSIGHVAINPLLKNVPTIFNSLDDVRKRALINLCFNMGIGTLLDFKNTLGELREGDYEGAANNLIKSAWYRQVKTRGPRVVYMIRTGKPHSEYDYTC